MQSFCLHFLKMAPGSTNLKACLQNCAFRSVPHELFRGSEITLSEVLCDSLI